MKMLFRMGDLLPSTENMDDVHNVKAVFSQKVTEGKQEK